MDNEEIGFHVRLSSVSRVAETKTHLVLFKRRTPFLAIPKTAFARPDDATAFARFLGRMIAPAGQTPYPPETRHE
nr:YcxB family protein [Microvirga antarctica]